MHYRTFLFLSLLICLCFPIAEAKTEGNATVAPSISATNAAKEHVISIISVDLAGMKDSYAKSVILMPHHELLGPKHGLAGDEGRKAPTLVDGVQLATAYQKARGERKPVEKIRALVNKLEFLLLKTNIGDFALDPPDAEPLNSPDGKLHFQIKKGDALIKFQPPRGDFILIQLRAVNDRWRVVAEYWD